MKTIKISEANKEVKVVDGKLFFDTTEVLYTDGITEDKIPTLYIVRVKDGKYSRFVTGLDLIGGKYWIGGFNLTTDKYPSTGCPECYFDEFKSIKHIFDNLCRDTAGKDWYITEEDQMTDDTDYSENN